MKIIYMAASRIPSQAANSVHVMKMCAAMSELGHDVELFPSVYGGDEGVYDYYGVTHRFPIREPGMKWIRNQSFQGAAMALAARRRGAELVFGRHLTGCLFSALLGMRVVFETHDDSSDLGARGRRMVDAVFRSAKVRKVVVISEPLRKIYADRYPEHEHKLLVAHDGADAVPIRREWSLSSPASGFKVGYIGHLYQGRGVELILELARRCPWASFHLVGGKAEDVARWLETAKGIPNLCFTGFLPPSEVEKIRSGFDALIAPYQRKVAVSGNRGNSAAWMSPLKIFEYMSSGTPIVASDLPALREILTDGEDALLCHPEDPDQWEKALERLRAAPALSQSLSARALERFKKEFTWAARAKHVLESVDPH